MKSYRELIEQTFEFPQKEFKVRDHELLFNDVPLMDIIKEYGTPLKLTYLPRISENIRFVQATFKSAMERFKYNGKYTYCYCTKSSHFSFIMEEALKNEDVHIETSSAFDIPIVRSLHEKGKISKDTHILCNAGSGELIIATHQINSQSALTKLSHYLASTGFERVSDGK